MPMKASELAQLLNKHIEKYGDGNVMIYDGYKSVYKSISDKDITRMPGNRFVIECSEEMEDEDV